MSNLNKPKLNKLDITVHYLIYCFKWIRFFFSFFFRKHVFGIFKSLSTCISFSITVNVQMNVVFLRLRIKVKLAAVLQSIRILVLYITYLQC